MGDIPNALWNFTRPDPMPNRNYGMATDDTSTPTPVTPRRPRPIGGTLLQMPNSGPPANAVAAATGAAPDSGQPANALNPGVMTPFGWVPAGLASQLADYLTPTRQGAASTLGAPVDAAAWMLKRFGLNVPGSVVDGVSADGSPQHWAPAPTVPLSSEFFNNLLGDAGDVSAEAWRRLRR
jgi:hypothetical protein